MIRVMPVCFLVHIAAFLLIYNSESCVSATDAFDNGKRYCVRDLIPLLIVFNSIFQIDR